MWVRRETYRYGEKGILNVLLYGLTRGKDEKLRTVRHWCAADGISEARAWYKNKHHGGIAIVIITRSACVCVAAIYIYLPMMYTYNS